MVKFLLFQSGSASNNAAQLETDHKEKVKLFSFAGWFFVAASLFEVDLKERDDLFSKVNKAFKDAVSVFIADLDLIDGDEERSNLIKCTFGDEFDGATGKQVEDAFGYEGRFFGDVLAAMMDDDIETMLNIIQSKGYTFEFISKNVKSLQLGKSDFIKQKLSKILNSF